jgi:hypothetical protein
MENETPAGVPPVEKAPEVKAPEASQDDAASLLAAKDAEISRLSDERENYRRAALKAKGKYHEEDTPDDLDELIEKKVQEKLYDVQIVKAQQEKEAILQKTLRENAELRNAIKNRPPAPSAAGANQGRATVGDTATGYWSPDQEADLKKKGLDPQKVWDNMNLKGMNGTSALPA